MRARRREYDREILDAASAHLNVLRGAKDIVDICDDRGGVVERLHVSRKSVRSVQRRVR